MIHQQRHKSLVSYSCRSIKLSIFKCNKIVAIKYFSVLQQNQQITTFVFAPCIACIVEATFPKPPHLKPCHFLAFNFSKVHHKIVMFVLFIVVVHIVMQGCATCCSLAARLRENGERMRKWRENEEIERRWRENEEMDRE